MKPLSRQTLIKAGRCCGNGCINCPYLPKHTRNSKMTLDPLLQPLFDTDLYDYHQWSADCYMSESSHKKHIKQKFGASRRYFMTIKRLLAVLDHIAKTNKPTLGSALGPAGVTAKGAIVRMVRRHCQTSWLDFKRNPDKYRRHLMLQLNQ